MSHRSWILQTNYATWVQKCVCLSVPDDSKCIKHLKKSTFICDACFICFYEYLHIIRKKCYVFQAFCIHFIIRTKTFASTPFSKCIVWTGPAFLSHIGCKSFQTSCNTFEIMIRVFCIPMFMFYDFIHICFTSLLRHVNGTKVLFKTLFCNCKVASCIQESVFFSSFYVNVKGLSIEKKNVLRYQIHK